MWNPFKTLTQADSARLRRLETQVNDLADDIEQCLNLIPKINARLRQRSRRAIEGELARSEDATGDSDGGDVAGLAGPALVGQQETPASLMPPKYTKEQLRGFARARGLAR